MMAAPVVLGLGGGIMFGQFGFAAGWLIGSWLLNRKQKSQNEIIDPGAEEMPRFNQSLRGVTLPILFGTNKVSSQIILEDNFTVVRKETTTSQGGGKSGGSGGGKVGTQETTEVSYEYFWDVIYHLGMPNERFKLFGGWLGTTRLTGETIIAIANSTGSSGGIPDVSPVPEEASLGFEDAFFNDGAVDGDITTADVIWDHIPVLLEHEVRWPGTCWVGFKQLFLGTRPHIPQLFFEIGPGPAEITADSGYIWKGNVNTYNTDNVYNSFDKYGQPMMRASTGRRFIGTDGTNLSNDFKADIIDQFNTYYDGAKVISLTGSSECIGNGLMNGEYYIAVIEYQTECHFGIFAPQKDALPILLGAVWYKTGINFNEHIASFDLAGDKTAEDPIICFGSAGGSGTHWRLTILPSIDDIKSNPPVFANGWGGSKYGFGKSTYDWGAYEIPQFIYKQATDAEAFAWALQKVVGSAHIAVDADDGGWSQQLHTQSWTVPQAIPTVDLNGNPTISYHTRIYTYWNKQVAYSYNTLGVSTNSVVKNTLAPANPNGWIGYYDMDKIVYSILVPSSESSSSFSKFLPNAYQVDNANWDTIPFDDSRKDRSGNTQDSDYQMEPTVYKLANGAYLIFFVKNFGLRDDQEFDASNISADGIYHKVRVIVWDPLAATGTEVVSAEGFGMVYTDPVGPGPFSSSKFTYHQTLTWFDEANQDIYFLSAGTNRDIGEYGMRHHFYKFATLNIFGGDDITPPEIIYPMLTDQIFGIGVDTADVDFASYSAAVTYCRDNGFLVSTQYRREVEYLELIEQLLDLYGGFLIISQGQIKFGLLSDQTIVRTIDNHHFIKRENEPPVKVREGAKQDTVNRVVVNYIDRALDYQQNQTVADDEADQELYGVRKKEFAPQFVMSEQFSSTLAWRSLYNNLYVRADFEFELGIKDSDLEPGDVIFLVDSYHPYLEEGVVARIVTWGERTFGQFNVTAKEEEAFISAHSGQVLNISSTHAQSLLSGGGLTGVAKQVIYELPAQFQLSDQGVVYAGWMAEGGRPFGATAYVSTDGVTFAAAAFVTPYPIAGRLVTELPDAEPGTFIEDIEIVLFPDNNWLANSPTYWFNETLSSPSDSTRAVGGSLLYIGSEMIAYEGANLVSQNWYRLERVYRGWGGTNIHSHKSGDFFHKHGSGIFSQAFTEGNIGQKLQLKIAPVSFSGKEINVASIDPSCYTLIGRHYTPQNPPKPRYVELVANSWDFRGRTQFHVSSEQNLSIFWNDSARKSGYGFAGYGFGGYGRFTTDPISTSWRVEVVGSGDVTVRSVEVATPAYTYTNSDNVADNGAWRPNNAFSITAINEFGSSIRTRTVSLDLNAG